MKQAFKFAASMLTYHLAVALVIMIFAAPAMETPWLFYPLNAALLGGYALLLFHSGGDRGERAATVSATMERQMKEGRATESESEAAAYRPATAVWGYVLGVLPLLILAALNLALKDMWPNAGGDGNWLSVATRVVMVPYIGLAQWLLGDSALLYALYIPCALLLPALMPIGYLRGPALHKKKLEMIEKGKKRKMRNLRVNKKPRVPKPPKMEV